MTLEELYDRYGQDVYRFAYWLCGNAVDADDIASETFLRAWAGGTKLRTATVKAYLLAIARNYYLELQRRQRRLVPLSDELPWRSPAADVRAEAFDALHQVRQALLRLSEIDQSALLMRAQGVAYEDIAAGLGISLSSAKVKVHRARLKLAGLLNRDSQGRRRSHESNASGR